MKKSVRDVMTVNPISLQGDASATEAARKMRDSDIGGVVVQKNGDICGIVTDRDLAIRVIAEGKDPATTSLESVCSKNLTTISPSDSLSDAVNLMREKALRRILVTENKKPLGIVSLGDLAVAMDRDSALGAVSAAAPNR